VQHSGGWSIRAFFETTLIAALFCILSHYFHTSDPCFVHTPLPIPLIVLAIVSLYYGYGGGLPFLVYMGLGMWVFYREFPLDLFLVDSVLMLLLCEFHAYWFRTLRSKSATEDYLRAKFDELSNTFYMLKISHDQLEKNYVVKPMSLRNAIAEIQAQYRENPQRSFEFFLTLLKNNFSVTSAIVVWKKKGKFETVAGQEDMIFSMNDPLVEEAIDRKEPIFIPESTDLETDYIAVIPALVNDEVTGFLCIKEMPFMSFNKDNLVSLAILLDYFAFEVHRREVLLKSSFSFTYGSDRFRFELQRLETIEKQFGLSSAIIVFHCEEEIKRLVLEQEIEKNLRSLDIFEVIEKPSSERINILLFPFSDKAVVEGYVERLRSILQQKKIDICPHSVFTMKNLDLLQTYLTEDSHAE